MLFDYRVKQRELNRVCRRQKKIGWLSSFIISLWCLKAYYCACSKMISSRPSPGTWKFRISSICLVLSDSCHNIERWEIAKPPCNPFSDGPVLLDTVGSDKVSDNELLHPKIFRKNNALANHFFADLLGLHYVLKLHFSAHSIFCSAVYFWDNPKSSQRRV